MNHQHWEHADGGRWSDSGLLGMIDSPVTDLAFSFAGPRPPSDGKLCHSYHWLEDGDWTPWTEIPRR